MAIKVDAAEPVKVDRSRYVGKSEEQIAGTKNAMDAVGSDIKKSRDFITRAKLSKRFPKESGEFLAHTEGQKLEQEKIGGLDGNKEWVEGVLNKFNDPSNNRALKDIIFDEQRRATIEEERARGVLVQVHFVATEIDASKRMGKATSSESFLPQMVGKAKELKGNDTNTYRNNVIAAVAGIDLNEFDKAYSDIAKCSARQEILDKTISEINKEGIEGDGETFLESLLKDPEKLREFGAMGIRQSVISPVAPLEVGVVTKEQVKEELFEYNLPELELWEEKITSDLVALSGSSEKKVVGELNSNLRQFFVTAEVLKRHSNLEDRRKLSAMLKQIEDSVNDKVKASGGALTVRRVTTKREKGGHIETADNYLSAAVDQDEKKLADHELRLRAFANKIFQEALATAYGATYSETGMDEAEFKKHVEQYMARMQALRKTRRGHNAGEETNEAVSFAQIDQTGSSPT
jgi:hypothetical protein